ncbi:unnamed protein product [Polarella glacialis]|uniref:Uncharacterized protein n=1 Tax=Polarella glacialis TaxID=89957 RepID=A0A813LM20_POLGL|nr:unnamed protein product [Polarella glacialis]CAE8732865.1 unnamed protein product [Polarella glacialis]
MAAGVKQQPTRARPPPPLMDLMVSVEKEEWLVQTVRSEQLLDAQSTAAPWNVHNVYAYLQEARPIDGFTALHLAAEMGFPSLATQIVEGGPPGSLVDRVDRLGRTPLMVASMCQQVEVITALLAAGAAIGVADHAGKQALHHAILPSKGACVTVNALLAARADANTQDENGLTPLMIATALDALPCMETLVRHGAKVICFDRDGRMPLDLAQGSRRERHIKNGTTHAKGHGRYGHTSGGRTFHRWDNLGSTEAQQLLLLEERTARRRAVPAFGEAEGRRLHAALPLLC